MRTTRDLCRFRSGDGDGDGGGGGQHRVASVAKHPCTATGRITACPGLSKESWIYQSFRLLVNI